MVLKNLDEKIDEILVRRTDRIINELKKEKIIKEETAVLRFIIRKAITDTVRDLDGFITRKSTNFNGDNNENNKERGRAKK